MKADGFVLANVSMCCFFSHSEWRDGQAGLQLLPGPRGTGERQTHWHRLQVQAVHAGQIIYAFTSWNWNINSKVSQINETTNWHVLITFNVIVYFICLDINISI